MNPTVDRAPSPAFLPALLLLFAGSGCAALIYEVVWFQLLQLVIGLTNVSLGLLLGMFMGGMCLGSLLLPRTLPPRHHPLRVYAVLELAIAVLGVAMLFIIPRAAQWYTSHPGSGPGGAIARGILAATCLLPPTILMGATLPAIARGIETTRAGVSWLGFFYGGNIAGAVAGCLLAGFYLLRVHDMATATYAAAGINTLVALIALALAKSPPTPGPDSPIAAAPVASSTTNPCPHASTAGRTWPVHLAIALSGAAALGAEVVWTRLLALLMGGTVYTFSIILAVFLVGLGIGSGAGSFLARTLARPRAALGACQLLLMGAVAWAALMASSSLPYWPVNPTLSLNPWFNFQLDLVRCLWVVLPGAILWGASFPLALAAVASPGQDPGRLVGGIYASNTVGAILGALVFSLLLVPLAGTQNAERSLIVLSAAAAVLALSETLTGARDHDGDKSQPRSRTVQTASLLLALGLGAWLVRSVPPLPWGLAAYGRFLPTYGNRLAPDLVHEKDIPIGGNQPDIYCTYLGEGLNGTIAVTRWTSGVRSFHSAGKVQASSDPRDMRLQRMLGHLSALTHPRPESVLVVACGAGVTAGSFVTHPETKRIVICDIEPLVPRRVAPMFARENFDVIHDPRTEVISDDGRHFIRTTREKFDIITSDPIDPWVKGCAALNTLDYYEMCKTRLKPGGIMSLWLPLYESNPETVRSVVATFFQAFPNGILWSNDDDGEGYDTVLLGQIEPTRFDLDALQDRLGRPDHARVRQSLAEAGFHSAIDLVATYAGQARDLTDWTRNAQINTDANLRLQYLAGWSANSFMGAEILNEILRHKRFPENLFAGSPAQLDTLRTRLRK